MDSQPITDNSGYGKNATFTGSPRTTRPIVAKGIGAQLLESGDAITYPIDNIMRVNRESRSFTLEAWVKPTFGNTEILTRDNSGLFLDGLKLRFTIDMGVLYSVEYKNLRAGEIYHVVAVYDGTGIYLFLNGVKVAGADIDIPAPFEDTSVNLFSNTSSSVVLDSVAVYSYALPVSVIANHYLFGTDYPSVTDISKINGGTKYDFIDDSTSVYAKAVFPETLTWTAGVSDGTLVIIGDQLVNLYSDIDLEFQAGTWTYQESLESDALSTIVASRIIWSASDDITVEKSEDGGTTWTALSNGGQIVSGMPLTTGYGVSIRVSIPSSVEQIVLDYLSIAFYSSLDVRGDDEDLPATILNPAGTRIAERHIPAASFNDNAGITFLDSTSGMTIPGDEAFGGYFAVEMTVKVDSGANSATVLYVDTATAQPQVTTDATGNWTFSDLTALYVDGASITSGSAISTGEWHHVLAVFPESLATIYVGNGPTETAGYPMQIGHLATYSDDVSASDALAIYRAWVGAPSVSISDGGTINISENSPVPQGLMGLMGVSEDVSVSGTGSAYPDAVRKTNPVIYWRFEENAGSDIVADSAGTGIQGHLMYGVQQGVGGLLPCGSNKAVGFGGTGTPEVIVYGGEPGSTPNFSAACIIQTTSTALMFTWNRMSSIAAAHGFYLGVNNGHPEFKIWPSGATYTASSVSVNDGLPHHLAVTFTQGGPGRIYVDGDLVLTTSNETLRLPAPGIKLGANDAGVGGSFPFNGIIDEAASWNRALSADEIATLGSEMSRCKAPLFRGYSHDWAIVSGG